MIFLLTLTWIRIGGENSTEFARSRAPIDPDTDIRLMRLLLMLGMLVECNKRHMMVQRRRQKHMVAVELMHGKKIVDIRVILATGSHF